MCVQLILNMHLEAAAVLCTQGPALQVYTAWEQCVGKKSKIKGESDEYTLEVIKYKQGNKGDSKRVLILANSCKIVGMLWTHMVIVIPETPMLQSRHA